MKQVFVFLTLVLAVSNLFAETGFCPGMRWFVTEGYDKSYDVSDFNGSLYELELAGASRLELNSVNITTEDETDLWQMIVSPVKQGVISDDNLVVAFIKREGERIYFKDFYNFDEWFLLYDFSITMDDTIEVNEVIQSGHANKTPLSEELYCFDIIEDGHNLVLCKMLAKDFMPLSYYFNEDDWRDDINDFIVGTWIKGLGSTEGPLQNMRYGMIGAPKSFLIRIELEGEILYERDWLSKVAPNTSPSMDTHRYTIDGRLISDDEESGLFIQNGKIHFSR